MSVEVAEENMDNGDMDEVTEGKTNVSLDKINVLCVRTVEEDLQVYAIWDKKKHNEIDYDYIQRIQRVCKPCDLTFSSESNLEEHKRVHSNLSYLNNIAPLCIISSKLRVGINTPIFSCGQEYLHHPVAYGMV